MVEHPRSSAAKSEIIDKLGSILMRLQDAAQKHDEAVGTIYSLGPAERLCLSFLWSGPQTASAIARETRLTRAAVTALIDRLEKRGFVHRKGDPTDRRKVLVEAAEATQKLAAEVYLPMRDAGARNLMKYSEAELELVTEILIDSLAIQTATTEQLLARKGE